MLCLSKYRDRQMLQEIFDKFLLILQQISEQC